jgi:hypothetical protein
MRQTGELENQKEGIELGSYIGVYAGEGLFYFLLSLFVPPLPSPLFIHSGAAARDKAVGDEKEEELSEAQKRALNLKEEAIGVAAERIQEILKDAETVRAFFSGSIAL